MDNEVGKLMAAWRDIGGGVLELLEALKTDQGREMAHAYGVSDADIAELQELSRKADELLARLAHGAEAERPVESDSAWAWRWARRLAGLGAHDPGQVEGRQETELGGVIRPSNATRFPDALRVFQREVKGTVEEFNALTPEQLVVIGVSEAELAEELARAAWAEMDSPPDDFDKLTAEQRAKLLSLFGERRN